MGVNANVTAGVSEVVSEISPGLPVERIKVDTKVGTGKGLSAESGATKITATTITNTNMAPSMRIVRMSQKEYVFIENSQRPRSFLSQNFRLYLAPGIIFCCQFKSASDTQQFILGVISPEQLDPNRQEFIIQSSRE